jgi:hypothetical protein
MTDFDNHCADCDRPIKEDYERCFDCDREYRNELLQVEGKLSTETPKGYGAKLEGYEGRIVWLPKSVVEYGSGAFWVPRWLAEEKGIAI